MHPVLIHGLAILAGFFVWVIGMSTTGYILYLFKLIDFSQLKLLLFYGVPVTGLFVGACILFQSLRR
jgi:hypothetical protein